MSNVYLEDMSYNSLSNCSYCILVYSLTHFYATYANIPLSNPFH